LQYTDPTYSLCFCWASCLSPTYNTGTVGGRVANGYFGEFTVGAHPSTVAHEFGHMLYLNDHYNYSNPNIICGGYTAKNIMANGYPAKIHPNDINDVIEGDSVPQCQ